MRVCLHRALRRLSALMMAFGLLLTSACADMGPPRDLHDLTQRDSTYYDPMTLEPYTGAVFLPFDDTPDEVLLRGMLRDGTWNGELTIYHPSGRVRFQGEMADGTQCGGWFEDEDDSEAEDDYAALKRELESIVMYPSCP